MAHEESDICGTRPFKGFNSRGISNLIYYCEFSLACTHFAHALHLIRMLINPIRFRSLPNDMIKKSRWLFWDRLFSSIFLHFCYVSLYFFLLFLFPSHFSLQKHTHRDTYKRNPLSVWYAPPKSLYMYRLPVVSNKERQIYIYYKKTKKQQLLFSPPKTFI